MTTKQPQPPPTRTPDPNRPVTPPPPRRSPNVHTAADLRHALIQAAAERQQLRERIDSQQRQINHLRKQVRHLLARLYDDC
ncbi:hypothetical protein Fuma_00897 [Fuerstiella marisgermanici]|uniref:Uncharacterized protein n=1 Tax=Fuerstiella marisgermanici TaxID=1891926 RepID=A0A1P8WB82_9PLAN|nr:hypothetical protein Fuma_00897 [Fuerstiella marisgermanici]